MSPMRRVTLPAIAIAALFAFGGAGAHADEHSPCAPQPMQKRCEQLDLCESAGAAPFENHSMSKQARVKYYKHCVWLEERYRLEHGVSPKGWILDPRDHRQKKVRTHSYPLLQRAECEAAGKKPYCNAK
jgi:hypothetical protein